MIASRILKCRIGPDIVDVAIRLYPPEDLGDAWRCPYHIDWPHGTWSSSGYGIDAVQAMLLALQKIGTEVYLSEYHETGSLFWLEPGDGFGFPVPPNVRDLLVGQDRNE
jgi:hypothetical protein